MERKKRERKGLTRREFIKTTATAGALVATGSLVGPFVARAAAAKKIKVGIVQPYTGVLAGLGQSIEAALRYAFHISQWRDQVEFYTEDSQLKPAVSVEKSQKLVEKAGIHILLGPAAGHTALAASEYMRTAKVPMLLPYGGNVRLAGKNCSPYTFMCGHTTYSLSAPATEWMFNNLGKEIYLVGSDYSTGRDITGWFKEGYLKRGGRVVGETYTPIGTSEFAPHLTKIMNAKPTPKVVAGFLMGSDAINFIKQYAEFGVKDKGIPIVFTLGMFSETTIAAVGEAATGMYDVDHWSPTLTNKESIEFKKNFPKSEYTKKIPGFEKNPVVETPHVIAYDVGTTMTYALDQTRGDTNPEKLVAAIEKREWNSPRGRCRFGSNHCVIHPTYIRQVKSVNGKMVPAMVADLGPQTTPGDAGGPGGECKM